jgi:hypothetical protein
MNVDWNVFALIVIPGFFTLRKLHRLTSELLRSRTATNDIDIVKELNELLDNILTHKY